jgi:hypothetical protein
MGLFETIAHRRHVAPFGLHDRGRSLPGEMHGSNKIQSVQNQLSAIFFLFDSLWII